MKNRNLRIRGIITVKLASEEDASILFSGGILVLELAIMLKAMLF